MQAIKKEQIDLLRKEILGLQGLGVKPANNAVSVALGALLKNMPGRVFPTGVVHEFLSPDRTAFAAATGFISALLNNFIGTERYCIWVSRQGHIFPPGLKAFGINPEQIIFIDAGSEKEALWIIEESLKCATLGAVIGELQELSFSHSRRLQLAVEKSKVTGFIHRLYPRNIQPSACVARWQIKPARSQNKNHFPGIGFPAWDIELLKIRNGQPGHWQLTWQHNRFQMTHHDTPDISLSLSQNSTA